MLLAYDGTADTDQRLAAILGRTARLHRFAAGRDPLPQAAAALVFDHTAPLDRLMTLHDECARRQVPWSMVVDRGRHLQIGPLFAPGIAPLCPQCAGQRLLHAPIDGVSLDKSLLQRRVASEMLASSVPAYPQTLLQLIAATAVDQLRHPAAHAGHVVVLDSVGFAVVRAVLAGIPGCRTCRPAATGRAVFAFTDRVDSTRPNGARA